MDPKSTAFNILLALAQPLPAVAANAVPDWLHLLPKGKVQTEDGRDVQWDGTPIRMMSFHAKSDVPRIIIDANHATALRSHMGEDVPALGWIVELQFREDGMWGRTEWTEQGRARVAAREYLSISPELFHAEDGTIYGIRAVSLTNRPNFKGLVKLFHANNQLETDKAMDKLLAKLAGKLSLKADAGEEAVVAAVEKLAADFGTASAHVASLHVALGTPTGAGLEAQLQMVKDLRDPAKTVPASDFAAVKASLHTVSEELKAMKSDGVKAKAEAFVDEAIKAGHMGVKPVRAEYIAMHMANPEHAEKIINALPKMQGGSVITASQPGTTDGGLTEADLHVANMMGIDPEAMKKTKLALAA